MGILSAARRRRSLHSFLFPPFSTDAVGAATAGASDSRLRLSPSTAKSQLRKVYDPDKALSIISSVPNPSSSPVVGRFAVELAVRRLACAGRFADIESLLESRKSDPAAVKESFLATVILSYGSARMLDHAIATFNDVPRLCSASPTIVSFNALLAAAVQAKKHRQVPKLFSELSEKHSISPDSYSYGTLLKALCLSGKSNKAFETLKEMEEKSISVTTVIYTTLIDSLYKEGKPEKAEKLWNEMVEKGINPDTVTYNVKIMDQALNGRPEEVLNTIAKMEAAGLKPDTITYNYLMTCYSRNEELDNAKQVYKNISNKGCSPNSMTYKVMLNILCEKGDFDAGLDVFTDSMKHNKIPDFKNMKSLVVGLAQNSKVKKAKMVIGAVRRRFPGTWKVVEKELGLDKDGQASGRAEATGS